ncbi:MAG TPA: hypothetical protein VFR23_12560 [Jiangellaceae bacterium]|nr:hypothetical protein [Jiangellaceae bacterium]
MRQLVRRLTRRVRKALTAPATQPWSPTVRDYPRRNGSMTHTSARCTP